MSEAYATRLTSEELAAESATMIPSKEVLSLLDLLVDLDLALDLAAPIDLAVAANANVAAPISAAVSANVLSLLSNAAAVSDQSVTIDQLISGEAVASAPQTSIIDQSDDVIGTGDDGTEPVADGGTGSTQDLIDPGLTEGVPDVGSLLDGNLLNIEVNATLDADLAAPVAGAIAANANIAAPINASVAANVGAVGSEAVAVATQDANITQVLDDVEANATAEQNSQINQ